MFMRNKLFAVLALAVISAPVTAAEDDVPYWASIRPVEVNMHVGPGEDYRINWVYHRPGLPLKVVRKMEGWRLVEDPDGARGWMLARFLSRNRGAFVKGKGLIEMRSDAGGDGKVLWRLEPGVTGKLGKCAENWCRLDVDGHVGFVSQDRLWGAGEP